MKIPPQHALRFLRWFCRDDYIEEIEGNLIELYQKQWAQSPTKAKHQFRWNVLRHFRPAFIRSFSIHYHPNSTAMFRHNLLLAFRNFQRYKSSFFINLGGLSTGLTCTLLIYLWVTDELSVDKFHKNDDRLYQVMKNYTEAQGISTGEDTPGLLARALAEEEPEVERAVSVFPPADYTFNGILSADDRHMKARSKFADRDFFSIFSYPLLQGDSTQVLADPSSVVISKKLARNLFQSPDQAMGKRVIWKGERHSGEFEVAGVFESIPASATIQFDIVFTYDLLLNTPSFTSWNSNGPSTYVLLKEATDVKEFSDKIERFVKLKDSSVTTTLFVRPYSDRYLYNDYENGQLVDGRIAYVRLFSLIAIFILGIACINFMNLSTAKASRRFKEIGVKKALGVSRKTLLSQYLGESMLLTFMALVLALLLVFLFLPEFNRLTGKQLSLQIDKNLILSIVGIALLTGLIAGSYPALYLSGFNPVAILKGGGQLGNLRGTSGELLARKGLVVFQFMISIMLMLSVLVVYQQMKFIQSKNLGFERDNIITFTAEGKMSDAPETFLSEIKQLPGVMNASYLDGDLISLHSGTTAVEWEGKNPDEVIDFEILRSGYDLLETLDMRLKEGRPFSREYGGENSKVIFNEAAIERMGLSDPVGKTVTVWGEEKQIIGVVSNFHFESLYEPVRPFFFMFSDQARNLMVKIREGTTQETLAELGSLYQDFNSNVPFEYRFLDQDYQALYAAEQRVAVLSKYFSGMAILISCLGLFGLSVFSAERRLKEIGIRKVLGANAFGIVRLLSSYFTNLVLMAIIMALPISYLLAQHWLDDFAYRITLQWWLFGMVGVLALLVAWLTVGFQTVKAARISPVQCLKDE